MVEALELPRTLEDAHALILEQASFIQDLKNENEILKHRLDQHARRLFGKKSEQLDEAQLKLAFEALEAEAGEPETDAADEIVIPSHKRRRQGHGRTKFSDDIPRERVEIEPEDTTCPCCSKPMVKIGEETSERLDYVPATLRVILTVRPKYACPSCKDGVVVAPAPKAPIPKGKATASTLAHVAVSKYVDHLPLNRQAYMFSRQGVRVSKQTLGGWIRQVSALLEPIERAMWRSILTSAVLLADETPVKVLVPGRKETKRAYLWAYLGDHDEVAFDFSMGRGSDAPVRALKGYEHGVLMADAYAGYNRIVRERAGLLRAACWAHTRRRVFEAKDLDPDRALPLLALIRELYAVEGQARRATTSRAEREALAYVLRQEKSRKIVARIRERLERDRDRVLPKSPMGKAIRYALGQWTELTRFLDDGAIPLDTNAIERQLRVVAVGRGNWAFCGGEAGGHWAARLYGLLGTCKLQGVEPFAWLKDVLERVREHPVERMHELTPRIWAATPNKLVPQSR